MIHQGPGQTCLRPPARDNLPPIRSGDPAPFAPRHHELVDVGSHHSTTYSTTRRTEYPTSRPRGNDLLPGLAWRGGAIAVSCTKASSAKPDDGTDPLAVGQPRGNFGSPERLGQRDGAECHPAALFDQVRR